jgi:histidine triad (HIT) family protein
VPRYEDDPLELPWIPREGDPDEIAALAERIRSAGAAGGDGV